MTIPDQYKTKNGKLHLRKIRLSMGTRVNRKKGTKAASPVNIVDRDGNPKRVMRTLPRARTTLREKIQKLTQTN